MRVRERERERNSMKRGTRILYINELILLNIWRNIANFVFKNINIIIINILS